MTSNLMDKIISLAKRRGFIFPGSEIYGGLANSWDFGPLGVELKNNIKQEWWRRFVQGRDDIVGIDTAIIMNPDVWKASGHLKEFSDLLVECKECKSRFRADHIKKGGSCPNCGKELSKPRQFNLMFKTFLGPVEDGGSVVYLRPETAQGMFVNFGNVSDTARKKLPFGIAQIGKAFRNEVTPGNFIFRIREFEQMEIEYFIEPAQWQKHFDHWLKEMKKWIKDLGINSKNIKYREVPSKERAHYSKKTVDIDYQFPFGAGELYGLAYRGDFDLKNHGFKNPPHVIEPTWGVERTVLAAMLEAYKEEAVKDEVRAVLKFPYWLAPVKVAVLPLAKKPQLAKLAKKVYKGLLSHFACEYDETQSIGKRYRRQDEIGTPFCVTIDFESDKNGDVTVRERDSMRQKRIKIINLEKYLNEVFSQNNS